MKAFIIDRYGNDGRIGEMPDPELGDGDVLVEIISGDRDAFFPLKNTWLLYRELADAQVAVFPLAGHAPHQQHPTEVAAQIERFLSKN